MVKVGDKVWVKVLNKYNFRGTILEIEDNIATIKVPVHYGNENDIIVHKDIDFLYPVPETLKQLEDLKKKGVR